MPQFRRIVIALAGSAALIWGFFKLFVLAPLRDFDDFWHLWSGRAIVESGFVSRTDPVCFSSAGLDWVNLNWLSQLLNYRLFQIYGFAGPVAMASLAAAVVLVCHLYLLGRMRVLFLPALLSFLLVFYRDYMSFSTRPQVYSFALLAVISLILKICRDPRRLPVSAAAAIAAIMLIWNNLHGGCIFGYALLGCDLLGSAIEQRRTSGGWLNQRTAAAAAVISIGLSGFYFHPHGLDALSHTLFYGSSMQKEFYDRISELRPIDFGLPAGKIYLLYVAAFGLIIYKTRNFSPYREIIAFLLFAALTQSIRRFFTPLIIVSAPFAAVELSALILADRGRYSALLLRAEKLFNGFWSWLSAALAAALLVWFAIFLPTETPEHQPGSVRSKLVDPEIFPVDIAQYLKDAGRDGRIFNDYNAGGFLGWALYPEKRIVIDGRGDLHSLGPAYRQYVSIVTMELGWEDLLEKLAVRFAVLPDSYPLAKSLGQSPDWRIQLKDRHYLLFERTNK